jgi:signal transduction histidine kinase
MRMVVRRNSDRLMRLVTDLLGLDRLEAGRVPLERAPVRVSRPMADVFETTSAIRDEAHVRLKSEVDSSVVDVAPTASCKW